VPETQSSLKAAGKVSPPSSFLQNWTNPEVKGQWMMVAQMNQFPPEANPAAIAMHKEDLWKIP